MAKKPEPFQYSAPDPGTAYPKHLVDLLWSWVEYNQSWPWPPDVCRPRSREQLAALVNPAFQASLQSEEGRPIHFRAFLADSAKDLTVRFDAPLPYNASELVKIAPTVDSEQRALVIVPRSPDSDHLHIVGIRDPDLSPSETMKGQPRWEDWLGLFIKHYGWTLSVLGPGAILLQALGFPVELRHGEIRCPFPVHRIDQVREWYKAATVAAKLGDETIAAALLGQTWQNVLSKVCEGHHGGTFLILPTRTRQRRLLNIKYHLDSDVLAETLRARMGVEPMLSHHLRGKEDVDPALLDDAHFLQRDLNRATDLIASLASVDGAVAITSDLRIVGFGAEIIMGPTPQRDEAVKLGRHPDPVGVPQPKSLLHFGMRHRSAYRFCQQVPGAVAFVVSQDAAITVFCNIEKQTKKKLRDENKVRMYEGLTPERWIA